MRPGQVVDQVAGDDGGDQAQRGRRADAGEHDQRQPPVRDEVAENALQERPLQLDPRRRLVKAAVPPIHAGSLPSRGQVGTREVQRWRSPTVTATSLRSPARTTPSRCAEPTSRAPSLPKSSSRCRIGSPSRVTIVSPCKRPAVWAGPPASTVTTSSPLSCPSCFASLSLSRTG